MSLAVLASRALCGLEGHSVRVEVHVGSGLPTFTMVGLPNTGVRESRDRVRSAIVSSGYEFPPGRITVNLAPADIPKESGRFDLPIAFGILLASGQITFAAPGGEASLINYVFAGELSLTGAVMPVAAPLAIALAVARTDPQAILVMPPACAQAAAQVPGLKVLAPPTLGDLVGHFTGSQPLPFVVLHSQEGCEVRQGRRQALAGREAADAHEALDTQLGPDHSQGGLAEHGAEACLSAVRGQPLARKALEVAAGGGHSLLMSGSPGTGKSMLAQRLPGILPRLDRYQALEAVALANIAGGQQPFSDLPPFRSPHHTASVAALVGGGRFPKPGEISLAHRGVLFLDELPEFNRQALESLREPLETGKVTIARASRTLTYPASFQLVAAMNPCPCGWMGHPFKPCNCSPDAVRRYREKISGPLLDRIDIQVSLPPADIDWLNAPPGETSAQVRARVLKCRERQLARQQCVNAMLDASQIDIHCRLEADARQMLSRGLARWRWSARVLHRLLRIARTIADFDDARGIAAAHLADAIRLRQPWET